jgi:hypothetical protein
MFDPALVSGGGKGHKVSSAISYQTQFYAIFAVYIICSIYYFIRILGA